MTWKLGTANTIYSSHLSEPDTPVSLFTSDKQVEVPFKVIGMISYTNPGKYQILSLADVVPELLELAREAGANGIIIDESHVVKSGIISTGIGVNGRAILINTSKPIPSSQQPSRSRHQPL